MVDTPITRPEEQDHYVGTPGRVISFACCIMADGRVVVHSTLCDIGEESCIDFLYEVVERSDALYAATSMVQDAVDYLQESGDRVDENPSAQDFLDKLKQQLTVGLH